MVYTLTEEEAAKYAQALREAGFDPPPHIGQQWVDPRFTWLPSGHRSVVTITGLWRVEAGWSVTVTRREIDAAGMEVPRADPDREGTVFVSHLFRDYTVREDTP